MSGRRSGDGVVRVAMSAAVVTVAGVAAWTSYRHTVAMVAAHGEDVATARLIPVTTDGLILAAGLVLLHCARSHRQAPGLARWLLGLGVVATLAANVDHGAGHGVIGAVVAAWPATAFVGVSELALWLIRASGPAHPHDAAQAASAAPLAGPDWLPDVLPPRPGPVQTVTARTDTGQAPGRGNQTPTRRADVDRVRKFLAERPGASGAEVAAVLGVSERHGRRLRAAASGSD